MGQAHAYHPWNGGFVETINNQDGAGGKFTVAQAGVPQVSFWSRPEFRIFATYLNDAENDNAFAEGKTAKWVSAYKWELGSKSTLLASGNQ